jgi:hypothetical protein
MKGDFTRRTFNRRKHYRKVKMQQGRVQVDADWNEQVDIDFHYERSSLTDLVGPTGTPIDTTITQDASGFQIEFSHDDKAPSYTIRKGHYYVDGILCENEKDIKAFQQEDLPIFKDLSPVPPDKDGHYIVYLDVWERHITALDDYFIRDVALMGADTATRSKIVWQVKLRESNQDADNCLPIPTHIEPSGKLRARARPIQQSNDPCILPPESGYRGLGTQLYRVEISDSGEIGSDATDPPPSPPTFKWSRDNSRNSCQIALFTSR